MEPHGARGLKLLQIVKGERRSSGTSGARGSCKNHGQNTTYPVGAITCRAGNHNSWAEWHLLAVVGVQTNAIVPVVNLGAQSE